MSGIVGIVQLDGAPVDRDLLAQMTDYMAFRGPDGQDVWLAGNVGLGHTLLRTTFESEREQGVTTIDGQVWITADVRLDGRRELIDNLCAQGRDVTATATDVELVLHAYHLWGEAALDHLMGDFAFAIWDGRCQRLFCAHDHFGVVPLYYAQIGNCLLFSNTLNTLRLHPAVSDMLNEQAVGDSLLFMINMDLTTTIFADIQRLPPTHSLTCVAGEVVVRRYFSFPEQVDHVRYKRKDEYIERFRRLFDQAVADRLRTSSAGTFLSGGMDSPSIAATAQLLLQKRGEPFDFRAYTIVYERLIRDDEGDYASMVVEKSGFPVEYLVAEDFLERSPLDAPSHLSPEPTPIANQTAEYEIARRVATYGRVLLSGFGGDPLFESTAAYAGPSQRSNVRRLYALSRHLVEATCDGSLPNLLQARWQRQRGQPIAERDFPVWLQPDFVARNDLRTRWQAYKQLVSPGRNGYGMMTAPLWSYIFATSDPGVTGLPLRMRCPFFDLRLVRFMLTVPPESWLVRKRLLRMAMWERLPKPLLRRQKTPLRGNPHANLARQRGAPAWMNELLAVPELLSYVDGNQCQRHLQSLPELTPITYSQFCALFPLAYWLRHQNIRFHWKPMACSEPLASFNQ